jgi:hypothetical protein
MSACICSCMSSGIVWRIYVGFVVNIDILRVPPPGPGHAFPKQEHMLRGGVYLFLSGFLLCMMPIHGWMSRCMDKSHDGKVSRKTTTTSFTICNSHQNVGPNENYIYSLLWESQEFWRRRNIGFGRKSTRGLQGNYNKLGFGERSCSFFMCVLGAWVY